MTLRHLNLFVTVYQCQSITKAARKLHLAQPSVSLAIRELEEHYQLRLFDRMSRRIFPTEDGSRFYRYALHIISLFDEMEAELRQRSPEAPLRIGSGINIGACLLPDLLEQFCRRYPNVPVSALVKNHRALEEALLANEIDFALIEGSSATPQLLSFPFKKDRLCLLCAPEHPLAARSFVEPEELGSWAFLLREPGSSTRETVESLRALRGLSIRRSWESASNDAIIAAVKKSLGITILPRLLVKQELESGTLKEVPLLSVNLEREFSVLFHKNKYLPEPARNFLSLCVPSIFQFPFPEKEPPLSQTPLPSSSEASD